MQARQLPASLVNGVAACGRCGDECGCAGGVGAGNCGQGCQAGSCACVHRKKGDDDSSSDMEQVAFIFLLSPLKGYLVIDSRLGKTLCLKK